MPKNNFNDLLAQALNYAGNNQAVDKKIAHDKQLQIVDALLRTEMDKNSKNYQAKRDSADTAQQNWILEQSAKDKKWALEQSAIDKQRAVDAELRNKQLLLDHEKFILKVQESQRHIDAERDNQHKLDLEKQRAEIEENYMIKNALFNQSLARQVARMPNEEYRFSELGMSTALNDTPEGEETSGFLNMLWDDDMTDYINAGRGYVETEMGELGKRDVNDAQVQKAIKALATLYKKGNVEGYVSDFFDDNKKERNVLSQVVELMKDLGMKEDDIYKKYGKPIWME